MGRFYKTAKPQMVDFMYKIPEKALFAAIDSADKQYEEQVKYVSDMQKYLQAQVMASDQARTNEMLKEAEGKISEFTLNLLDSPSAARNREAEIRAFGQKLHENYTRGELAHYMNQKKAEDQFVQQESERLEKTTGRVLPTDLENFRAQFRKMYDMPQYDKEGKLTGYAGGGQWDEELKKGKRSYYSERLANFVDVEKQISDLLGQTWAASGFDNSNSQVEDNYIVDRVSGRKYVEYNDVLNTAMDAFDNNREGRAYYDQLIKNGLMRFEDVYGLYEYDEKGKPTGRLAPLMVKEVIDGKETGKMVEAKDAYGNTIPKNGGLKYSIAVNEARKLGFNMEKSGITGMKETEDYKAQLRMQEFMEQEAYKSKITGVDITNGVVSVNPNGEGVETYEQLMENIAQQGDQQYTDFLNMKSGMLGSIKDPTHKDKVNTLLTNAFQSDKPEDWKAVDDYLKNNKLRGLEYTVDGKTVTIGTGVNEFVNSQKALSAKKNDLANYANNVAYDAAYDVLNARYSDWKTLKPERQKELITQFVNDYNDKLERGQPMDAHQTKFKTGVDKKIKAVTQTTNNYAFFGGGEITESYAGEVGSYEVKEGLKKASDVSQVVAILGQVGSNAKITTVDAKTGKTITDGFNISQIMNMLGTAVVNKEYSSQLDNGTSTVVSSDNKLVFTTGTWKISPHDIEGMGVGTKQLNIAYNELDANGKPTGTKKIINVMVPGKNAIFSPVIEGSARAAAPDAAAVDLKKKGNNFYKNESNKIVNKSSNINNFVVTCKYGTGSTYNTENDTWTIPGNKAPIAGQAGQDAYAAVLRQKGIFPNEGFTPKQAVLTNKAKSSTTFQIR